MDWLEALIRERLRQMEEYKEVIRELLRNNFSPNNNGNNAVWYTTPEILEAFKGIVPQATLTDHDVFEILKEEGFQIDLKTVYIEGSKEVDHQIYRWRMFPIKLDTK